MRIMVLNDYYNYNEYVDECHNYDLDDDYILPLEKYCDISALYSLMWKNWYDLGTLDRKELGLLYL